MLHWSALLLALSFAGAKPAGGLSGHLTVHVDRPSHPISPMFFGMMTEEINHAYDGGLYAELIQNRSFTDSANQPVHWTAMGGKDILTLDKDNPVPGTERKVALRIDAGGATAGNPVGAANGGYWGIPVKPHTEYKATFYARGEAGFAGPLLLSLASENGKSIWASAQIAQLSSEWKEYKVSLKTGAALPSTSNRFVVATEKPGVFELAQVSLFPPTYKNRANGLRPDLMKLMEGLRPKFLRLPGGNYLEGNTIVERFDWKKTIGPNSQRPGHPCPWGYPSTDGMGLLEFLQWCEDLKMEPLLGVFAGYALRGEYIPAGPKLEPHIQDALDEIEYITGDTSTKWGARRAQDGHPKPFPLRYVEIGNEDWFDRSGSYEGRFAQFFDAFRNRYPKLKLIASVPVKSRVPDMIDDHYYRTAEEMARDSGHYDRSDRSGPKIFVGEWATLEGNPTPHLRAALGDAAWLTGLERNSDLVEMEAYAPLFVNVNRGASQWSTNLIGYDALSSYGSPAYWVQALFGQNTGDVVLPTDLKIKSASTGPVIYKGQAGVGTYRTDAEFKDFKVSVNETAVYQNDLSRDSGDWKIGPGAWKFEDGVLRQTGDATGSRALAGSPSWSDCTIEVKARKIKGSEGFFIYFHSDSSGDRWIWNLGGWNNTREAIQYLRGEGSFTELGTSKPMVIETGRWYDVKVQLSKGMIRCYLDGSLIKETAEAIPAPEPLYVAASKVRSTGEVILKLVNVSEKAADVTVDLPGIGRVSPDAEGWLLTGGLMDQNTIENPNKVKPRRITVHGIGSNFHHRLPAHSVIVLRIKRPSW